jgi:hypothetical protein
MKKSLFITVLLFAAHASAATITLGAPTDVTGGFDVTVLANGVFDAPHDGGDGLFGYGFDVSFDNSVFTYLGETAGSLFDDISSNPGLTADVAGVASVGFLQDGDFIEPLTLATLHFGVVGYGTGAISVNADSPNLDQGLQYLSGSDSFSAAASVTSTPEPATFMLAGLAVAGALALKAWLRA